MSTRAVPKTGPRRHRLLYVEGDAESVALMAGLVAGRKDVVLLHAADLDLGLQLARRERPEVLLINLDVVDIGAVHLMKLLQANEATRAAPILALSANAAADVIVKSLEAGFFQYLTKPLEAAPFAEALAYALEFAALERAEQD